MGTEVLEARRGVKVSTVLDGTGYTFSGVQYKIQGLLFKKQELRAIKSTKIKNFAFLAVSLSICSSVFHLLFNVMLPQAPGQEQIFTGAQGPCP